MVLMGKVLYDIIGPMQDIDSLTTVNVESAPASSLVCTMLTNGLHNIDMILGQKAHSMNGYRKKQTLWNAA